MALTKTQKADLAYEVMSMVEIIAARHDDAYLADSLNGAEWGEIAEQLAVWFQRLPGDMWHHGLPEVWNK